MAPTILSVVLTVIVLTILLTPISTIFRPSTSLSSRLIRKNPSYPPALQPPGADASLAPSKPYDFDYDFDAPHVYVDDDGDVMQADFHGHYPGDGLPDEEEQRKQDEEEAEVQRMGGRKYRRCLGAKAKGYYAHYPGFRLVGDDLTGALPLGDISKCLTACTRYGSSCAGVVFNAETERCSLKGIRTRLWSFAESKVEQTDLIGGCALWSNFVSSEMDAVCCLA